MPMAIRGSPMRRPDAVPRRPDAPQCHAAQRPGGYPLGSTTIVTSGVMPDMTLMATL